MGISSEIHPVKLDPSFFHYYSSYIDFKSGELEIPYRLVMTCVGLQNSWGYRLRGSFSNIGISVFNIAAFSVFD